jgi:asparaginyl-tRNA synthetase
MQKVPAKCFRVTTLPFDEGKIKRQETKMARLISRRFFGRATNLTVSGQLEGELAATAFGEIYTFGQHFVQRIATRQDILLNSG